MEYTAVEKTDMSLQTLSLACGHKGRNLHGPKFDVSKSFPASLNTPENSSTVDAVTALLQTNSQPIQFHANDAAEEWKSFHAVSVICMDPQGNVSHQRISVYPFAQGSGAVIGKKKAAVMDLIAATHGVTDAKEAGDLELKVYVARFQAAETLFMFPEAAVPKLIPILGALALKQHPEFGTLATELVLCDKHGVGRSKVLMSGVKVEFLLPEVPVVSRCASKKSPSRLPASAPTTPPPAPSKICKRRFSMTGDAPEELSDTKRVILSLLQAVTVLSEAVNTLV